MKKAKIMLLTIAVLAIVCGILAFKAQNLGSHKYCYIITNSQPEDPCDCTYTAVNSSMSLNGQGNIIYYTTTHTATPDACCSGDGCNQTARAIIN